MTECTASFELSGNKRILKKQSLHNYIAELKLYLYDTALTKILQSWEE
jgi:hypothetical protein